MPGVSLKVSEGERELWVAAADGQGLSLSEWLRRAANARLGSAGAAAIAPTGSGQDEAVPAEPSRDYITEEPVAIKLSRDMTVTGEVGVGEQDKAMSPTVEGTDGPVAEPSAPAPTTQTATEMALAAARELLGAPPREFRPDFKTPKAPKKPRR